MTARTDIAVIDPNPLIRPGRDVGRPPRPRNPRRSRRRTSARKARDRVRSGPPIESSVATQVRSVEDWESLPFAFVLDADFDQEDDDLTLGPAWRLAHAVRAEEDDAFGH